LRFYQVRLYRIKKLLLTLILLCLSLPYFFLIYPIKAKAKNNIHLDSLFELGKSGLEYGQENYGIEKLKLIIIKYPEDEFSNKSLKTLFQHYLLKKDYLNASNCLEEFQLRFPKDPFVVEALNIAADLQEQQRNYLESIRIRERIISQYPESQYARESKLKVGNLKYRLVIESNYWGMLISRFQDLVYGFFYKIGIPTQISMHIFYSLYKILILCIILGLSYILYRTKNNENIFWIKSDTALSLFFLAIIPFFIVCYFSWQGVSSEKVIQSLISLYFFLTTCLALIAFFWANKNYKEFFQISCNMLKEVLIILLIGFIAIGIFFFPIFLLFINSIKKSVPNLSNLEVILKNFNTENLKTPHVFLRVNFFAPIIEELLVRGLLYNSLKRKNGVPYAIILSSLFFGLTHWEFTTIYFFALFGTAIILTLIFEKTQSLSVVIIIHIILNLIATFF